VFSTTFRYSLISLLELANSEELLQAGTIASRHQLSHHYLAVVLAELRRLGLVQSHKGKKGGYRLACDPQQVNLLDLYHSLAGGGEAPRQGSSAIQTGSGAADGHRAELWLRNLVDRWTAELASTSLADLQGP
jgi:Rrf2 family cysteine metabolism transcriptional repressor